MLPQAKMRTQADDSGFTPTEIIIGVILIAILSTAVVSQALRLRSQAQDSSAQTTLRAAVTAARGVYSIVLRSGRTNFAADNTATATSVDPANVPTRLEEQEPAIIFVKKADFAASGNSKIKDATPQVNKVWAHLPNGNLTARAAAQSISANPSGYTTADGLRNGVDASTNIRAGDIIRMGLVGASGSSFCTIIVQDSSNGQVTGIGYQSVNEEATLAGYGADCGATNGALTNSNNDQWHEMPNTLGTDLALNTPSPKIDKAGNNAYGGKQKTGQET